MFRFILIICVCQTSVLRAEKNSNPRVCIIGAGVGGLSTARYLKAEGIKFTVLEATRYVGGTWRYDPRVGFDENGVPLHTSMYRHLHTNLPKPAMTLPGLPMPDHVASFPSQEDFYQYLQTFTKHFDLEKHIQFLHKVESVKRLENSWKVKHKHVVSGVEFEEEYDFVVVSTGHHSKPSMPDIPGEEKFKGTIIHSHSYRITEPYRCRRVLLIGAGSSGIDISLALTEVSSRVVHSHHSPIKFRTPFPDNYVRKPDVQELNETGAIFVDGTFEELDDIIYCTGYDYHYPFLDESSGLKIAKHSVTPLYKNVVNINQPTLTMLGLVVQACFVIALDAQARYTTALIKGDFTLPPHEEMMAEWQKRYDELRSQGKPMSHIHALDDKEDEYYADLTHESGIDRVPPVMYKIREKDREGKLENLLTYRHYCYKVIDSENFTRTLEDPSSEYKKFEETCKVSRPLNSLSLSPR